MSEEKLSKLNEGLVHSTVETLLSKFQSVLHALSLVKSTYTLNQIIELQMGLESALFHIPYCDKLLSTIDKNYITSPGPRDGLGPRDPSQEAPDLKQKALDFHEQAPDFLEKAPDLLQEVRDFLPEATGPEKKDDQNVPLTPPQSPHYQPSEVAIHQDPHDLHTKRLKVMSQGFIQESSDLLYHLNIQGKVVGDGSGFWIKVRGNGRKVSSGKGMSLVETDALFLPGLDGMKENYWIVELRRGEGTLLGIASVSTNAIYQNYESGKIGEVCVAYDDFIDIVDVLNARTVGQLKVFLCAGTYRQIAAEQLNRDKSGCEERDIVQHGKNMEDDRSEYIEVQEELVEDSITDGYGIPYTSDYSGHTEDSIDSLATGTDRQLGEEVKRWEQNIDGTPSTQLNGEILQNGQETFNQHMMLENGGNKSIKVKVQIEAVEDIKDFCDTPSMSDYSGPTEDFNHSIATGNCGELLTTKGCKVQVEKRKYEATPEISSFENKKKIKLDTDVILINDNENNRDEEQDRKAMHEDPIDVNQDLEKFDYQPYQTFRKIHNLALSSTIRALVGPACLAGPDWCDPFRYDKKLKVEEMVKARQCRKKDDKEVIEQIYNLADYKEGLSKYGEELKWSQSKFEDTEKELKNLMYNFFQLVPYIQQPGSVEAFGFTRNANTLYSKQEVGLRVPEKSDPLEPGILMEIYGDLHLLAEKKFNWVPKEFLTSTIELDGETHLMLGPIQLVNHDLKPNAEYYPDKEKKKIFLKILQQVQPGEEILINYGKEFKEVLRIDMDNMKEERKELRKRLAFSKKNKRKAEKVEKKLKKPKLVEKNAKKKTNNKKER